MATEQEKLEERSRNIQEILTDDSRSNVERILAMRRYLDGEAPPSPAPKASPKEKESSAPRESLLDKLNRRMKK